MLSSKKKIFRALLLVTLTLFLSAACIFFSNSLLNLQEGRDFTGLKSRIAFFRPRVTAETVLTRQRTFVCKDTDVIDKKAAPQDLRGLGKDELADIFTKAGWQVTFNEPKSLILTAQSEEFCPKHKNYRHLGLFLDQLAVYEGPLGYNDKVLRVETITVNGLPQDLQIKLKQAMVFKKMSGSAAEKLHNDLEFETEEVLNAALENMDEYFEAE